MTELRVRELLPGVHVLHLPLPMPPTIVNVYLVRGGEEWALVDTGMNTEESISAFTAGLRAVGCGPERIKKIICTHHHPDHFGASRKLKEMTGARVYLHQLEHERALNFTPEFRSERAMRFLTQNGIPAQLFELVPSPAEFWADMYATVPPDTFAEDGDVIRLGERELEVVWTPGHAPGHCVLYVHAEKVLIAGDHLLPKITPHVGWLPGGAPDPLGDFLDSQRKVQQLDVDLVLPAHGGAYRGHRHRAKQIIEHHHFRMREMWDIVRARPGTAYDVAARVFGFNRESSLAVQFPATFETLAHLRHMMSLGRVVCEERNGKTLYRGT